ncbi:MAG: hypothetical protein JWN83_412 [Chitinophagaceae bacterium]|nr:hypothetical protein [Chitinophagaceae bacterium]
MRKILFAFLLVLFSIKGFSQTSAEKLKVYLDCTQSWLCDFDYVRSEMKMVTFVRDRFDADVHVMVNTQNSSSGGIQAQINFIGQKAFHNFSDTLTYFNDPTTTEDGQRKKLVQYLKLGLVRYISKTPAGSELQISYADKKKDTASTTQIDKWKSWVYQIGANGSLSGSQNYKQHSVYAYISADKETEKWKINFSLSANRDVQIYIQDTSRSKFTRKEYYSDLQVARSINAHWSYGIATSYANSLYSNIKFGIRVRPKLEYSFYPYSKFNSQRIVVQYMLGPIYNNYFDTTVYFKTKEFQIQQSLNIITSFTQPWGSINLGIFYSNYFDDLSKNDLSFNGAVSWRIVKGLNFAVYGNYGLINDQIGLRKGSFTRDELLVRNRELKSSFQYNVGMGFSYRFGSISNSIVNPRFKGLNYSINF